MKKFFTLACLSLVMCVSVMASDAFRLHRYDMFHALPVRSTDIVMMGNSITDMPNWPEFFAGTQGRVINRGNSGGFSYEMRDNIECVLAGKPAKIFMKIGTNDLGGSTGTPASIAANVRICVEKTKALSPNTEFYIESILPAYNQGIKTPQTIAEANTLLKAIADEDANDKVYWVELNSLFGGAVTSLPSNCTLDNLHLSAGGYKIWCDAIVGNMGTGASVVLPNNIATTQNKCGLGHPNGTRNTYFSGVPVNSDNILVIGDEMIKCGEWQEFLGNDKVLNRGYGWGYGGSISVINTSLSAIFNGGTPKAVYLYTGTADLNNGASALETNKTTYTTLLNNIKTRMNGGKIVLLGNQPINDANINANSIKPFNEWLSSVAAGDDQIEYVDLYTPFVNEGTNNMNTRYLTQGDGRAYLYGLGYAKVAELMKPSLDAITGLDNDIVTESEAAANIAIFNVTSKNYKGGTGLGEYPVALVEALNAASEALKTAVAGGNQTEIEAKTEAYETALAALNGKLNMPTAANTTGKQFWLNTPKRSSRYAYGTAAGIGCANVNADYASYRWELEARPDGKFDIKNVGTGTYVDATTAHNSQMKLSATAGAGWEFQESDGYYILTSGTNAEFNMSNSSTMIVYNWYGTSFPNLTDDGCKFAIVEAEGEPAVEPTPDPIDPKTVFTIRAQFGDGSATRYLINNNGTLSTTTDKPEKDDVKAQWAITENTIQSLANSQFLGVNGGFYLSPSSVTLSIVDGVATGTKAIAESNRYGALKSDGTVKGGQFTGNKYSNWNGWSTDMIFELVDTEELPEPQDSYTIDKLNGSWTATNANGTWAAQWTSTDGLLTFTSNANNMQWNSNNIDARSGNAKSATYTLACTDPQYAIASYSFKAKALTSNQTWARGSKSYTVTSSANTTIAESGLEDRSVQFSLTGENTGTVLSEFTVVLKEVEVDPTLTEPTLVTVLKNAGSSVPYRIPAIASTKDGVLVVAADYRFTKADIGGGRLDLHLRRSFDYGKTWEDEYIKPENMMGNGRLDNDAAGFGDPCIVADRESNKMMILSCAGYPGFFSCTRDQHQRCARWYSEDNGATWTGPEFIDNTYVFEPLDNNSFGPAQGMFFGSGKIHQSRYVKVGDYYRLYAANSVRNAGGTIRNYVMYSDDFGQSWKFLGGVDAPAVSSGGDEPKAEELPDGSVLFSGRRNGAGGRNFNIFKFTNAEKAEGRWLGNAVSQASNSGVSNDNACNGEIQLVPVVRKRDNKKMWLALQSVPFGSGRNNVGIFYKGIESADDYKTSATFAANWEGRHQASWTSSCYSTMVVQGNKHIGFVYEENGSNGGYDIQYKDYTVEVLTDGKYSYDTEFDPETTVLPLSAGVVTPAAGVVEEIKTITVSFNKNVTAKTTNVTLAEGVIATVAAEENVLTLTLDETINETGKYELTIPAGIVEDADEQTNTAIELVYRVLGEELPLGAQVTTLAGINEHKTYALKNPASSAYAIYAPQYSTANVWVAEMKDMDASHKVSNTAYAEKANFADPNNAWTIFKYDGKTYVYNVGADAFLVVGRPTTLSKTPTAVTVAKISNGFTFNTTGGTQEFMCASPQLSDPIAIWTNTDAGSCWQLYENPNVEDAYDEAVARFVANTQTCNVEYMLNGAVPAAATAKFIEWKNGKVDFRAEGLSVAGAPVCVTDITRGENGTFQKTTSEVELQGKATEDFFYARLNYATGDLLTLGESYKATLELTEIGAATFCAPFAVELTGVTTATASTVTEADANGVLTLSPVAEGIIPANTPVLLIGTEPCSQDLYTIKDTEFTLATAPVQVGMLCGTYTDIQAPAGSYVMQSHSDKVGFYHVEGVQPTVQAHHCYLVADTANSVSAYLIENAVVGIQQLMGSQTQASAYDLQGRRTSTFRSGLYIQNHHKVLK